MARNKRDMTGAEAGRDGAGAASGLFLKHGYDATSMALWPPPGFGLAGRWPRLGSSVWSLHRRSWDRVKTDARDAAAATQPPPESRSVDSGRSAKKVCPIRRQLGL